MSFRCQRDLGVPGKFAATFVRNNFRVDLLPLHSGKHTGRKNYLIAPCNANIAVKDEMLRAPFAKIKERFHVYACGRALRPLTSVTV